MPARLFSSGAWPSQCAICRGWPTRAICDSCAQRFAPACARCASCALPVPAGVARCGACVRTPPPLDACLVGATFQWPWSGLIARLKFQQEVGLAAALAELLRRAPGVSEALARADCVLPMPLAPERLAARGYNPALLLARALARERCRSAWLLRVRDTPPQRGLGRAERLRNVQGAFALDARHAGALRGRHVVLVDDVMTTGASLFEAARTLRAAAAPAHVLALALARTELPQ